MITVSFKYTKAPDFLFQKYKSTKLDNLIFPKIEIYRRRSFSSLPRIFSVPSFIAVKRSTQRIWGKCALALIHFLNPAPYFFSSSSHICQGELFLLLLTFFCQMAPVQLLKSRVSKNILWGRVGHSQVPY